VTSAGKKRCAKVLVASLLTDEELIIHNVPLLRDVTFMLEVLKSLGVTHTMRDHTVVIQHVQQKILLFLLRLGKAPNIFNGCGTYACTAGRSDHSESRGLQARSTAH